MATCTLKHSGPISLHTSVTDLEIASLPGDLTLDSDDLRVTEAKGLVHVTTHSKDVDLSQIYGDIYVEDRNGTISMEPAGAYGVEAKNDKGDVEMTLPPNASATVNGHTHNGDIVTDFGLTVSGDEDKTVSGKIGSGAAHIDAEHGQWRPAHQEGIGVSGCGPAAGNTPAAPAAPNAPHLKSTKRCRSSRLRSRAERQKNSEQQAGAGGRTSSRLFCFYARVELCSFARACVPWGSTGHGACAGQGDHSGAGVRLARRGVCARSGGAAGLAAAGLGAGGRRGAHGRRGSEDWRPSSTSGWIPGTTATAKCSGRIRVCAGDQRRGERSSTPNACWS